MNDVVKQMDLGPFYRVLLTNLIKDVEAARRMLEESTESVFSVSGVVSVKSTLRRALRDAKEGMRSYEDE